MSSASSQPPTDHYSVLGVSHRASTAEIKSAYRALVKRHHPDAGGDEAMILALNAAWEVLGDGERRRSYDGRRREPSPARNGMPTAVRESPRHGAATDDQLERWLRQVYQPIDRLLGQVIDPFPSQLHALSADPYDDDLMEAFSTFLSSSQARMDRVEKLYRQTLCPAVAAAFGLSLYHCLSQVQDALTELERYTLGYVDSYLHDGWQMLREARSRRSQLHQERAQLPL